MKRKRRPPGIYHFFITLPDRLYPFSCIVAGKRVRGVTAYNRTLARIRKKYGDGSYGAMLITYRMVFHLVGAIVFIGGAAFISKTFFGSDVALYVLFVSAVLAITFQEFYFQPRHYPQHLTKGIIDWATWVVPIGAYFVAHFH